MGKTGKWKELVGSLISAVVFIGLILLFDYLGGGLRTAWHYVLMFVVFLIAAIGTRLFIDKVKKKL